MAGKLLIRMFDVGLGDCIYCRIPDGHEDGRDFHILIDCGSLSGMDYLAAALEKLKIMLPDDGAKKRLDLLIVTHQHKDHILGFTPDLWADVSVGSLWMSAAMDPDHPEARNARQLHAFAGGMIKQAQRLNFSPELQGLFAAYAATNDVAMETLQKTIPVKNNIKPVYVHAGMDTDDKLKLPLKNAALRFLDRKTTLTFIIWANPKTRQCTVSCPSWTPLQNPRRRTRRLQNQRLSRPISPRPTSGGCSRECCRQRSPSPISMAR